MHALSALPTKQHKNETHVPEEGNPQLNVVYVWLTSEKPTIKEGDCLCLPCVKQIQRNYNKPKYIPRWLPEAECEKKCSIESCKALVETTTSQMTVNELEDNYIT